MATDSHSYRQVATKLATAALLTAALAGCGMSTEDLTLGLIEDDEPAQSQDMAANGVYVVNNGKVGRLDEDPKKVVQTWDLRTNLPPNVRFMIVHDMVAASRPDADDVVLQRVARVRNNVAADGTTQKSAKTEWVAAELPAQRIPVSVTRNEGAPRILNVTTTQPLQPGLYSLTYRSEGAQVGGRFGIQWKTADKTQFASLNCVDRYQGNPAYYLPCEQYQPARIEPMTGAFNVHGLSVRREVIAGKPGMVLEGKLTNSSQRPQNAPLLLAVIDDKSGRELSRWTFRPTAQPIAAGETLDFRTVAYAPPAGAAGVTVTPVSNGQTQTLAPAAPAQPQPSQNFNNQQGIVTQPLEDMSQASQ